MDDDLEDPGICPVHGDPADGPFNGWAHCPVVTVGEDVQQITCEHFAGELEQRIAHARAGNFTRCWTDDDGRRWRQKFRDGKAIAEPYEGWTGR